MRLESFLYQGVVIFSFPHKILRHDFSAKPLKAVEVTYPDLYMYTKTITILQILTTFNKLG